jgi:hypothetical protein
MNDQLRYEDLKVGDTLGLLEYQLLKDGSPLPLPAGTVVVFKMLNRDTLAVIVDNQPGFVKDAAAGIVAYQRVTGDVDTDQPVICQFTSTLPIGEVHHSPDIEMLIKPVR